MCKEKRFRERESGENSHSPNTKHYYVVLTMMMTMTKQRWTDRAIRAKSFSTKQNIMQSQMKRTMRKQGGVMVTKQREQSHSPHSPVHPEQSDRSS